MGLAIAFHAEGRLFSHHPIAAPIIVEEESAVGYKQADFAAPSAGRISAAHQVDLLPPIGIRQVVLQDALVARRGRQPHRKCQLPAPQTGEFHDEGTLVSKNCREPGPVASSGRSPHTPFGVKLTSKQSASHGRAQARGDLYCPDPGQVARSSTPTRRPICAGTSAGFAC